MACLQRSRRPAGLGGGNTGLPLLEMFCALSPRLQSFMFGNPLPLLRMVCTLSVKGHVQYSTFPDFMPGSPLSSFTSLTPRISTLTVSKVSERII